MPRYARKKSRSNIYHVMLRGIDKMNIFIDEGDKRRFLETLVRMKQNNEYEIYAYCLMNNHVHLLIKEVNDMLERTMKRVCVSYVYYFNHRYERIGPLFQDRFRSEAIEGDSYFLCCARYIHNNPVKAGIAKCAESYKWSSYHQYIGEEDEKAAKKNILKNNSIANIDIDKKFLLDMFSENSDTAKEYLKEFTIQQNKDLYIDYGNDNIDKWRNKAKNVDDVNIILAKYRLTVGEFKDITEKAKRDEILNEIKGKCKVSVRNLAGILGVSKDIVYRA